MLHDLYFAKLTNLECGQHVKSVHANLTTSATITDPVLLQYMEVSKTASDNFDESHLNVTKSDETQKIADADQLRDNAIITLRRANLVFEYSKVEAEVLAYTSLSNLFANFLGMQEWNLVAETGGIEALLDDLAMPKYAAHVALLGLDSHVDRLRLDNDNFKALFAGRTLEESGKPVYNSKALRANLYTTYTDMLNYIVVMSKVPNANPQFSQALQLINVQRKYYADLLARRQGTKKAAKPSKNPKTQQSADPTLEQPNNPTIDPSNNPTSNN